MNIKSVSLKKVGGIATVLFTCSGFTGAVLADACPDRVGLAYEAEALARTLRCVDYPVGLTGTWSPGNPIWQYKGKKGDGCEVHYKLSKLLDEDAQVKQEEKGKGKANNSNRGIASALLDGQDQYAWDQAQLFMDTITYEAKLNPNYAGDAATDAASFVSDAQHIQDCILVL